MIGLAAAALTGCAGEQTVKNEPADLSPNVTETAVISEQSAAETPMAIPKSEYNYEAVYISVTENTEHYYDPAEGDFEILTFSYETPEVSVPNHTEAEAKINEALAVLTETFYTGNDYGAGNSYGRDLLLELATDNYGVYSETGEESYHFTAEAARKVQIARADAQVISLVFTDSVYLENAIEEQAVFVITLDPNTGGDLSYKQLFKEPSSVTDVICDYVGAVPDAVYGESVPTREEIAVSLENGNWYVTENEFVILVKDNNILTKTVVIPMDALTEVIDSRYLSAQRTAGDGEIELIQTGDYSQNTMNIVDRVMIDTEGKEFLMHVSGTVYNLTVSTIQYNNDKLYISGTKYFADYFTDCALQILRKPDQGMPGLMISYESEDGQTHTAYISVDENSGAVMVNGEITAVG